jgi:hypothetical protein
MLIRREIFKGVLDNPAFSFDRHRMRSVGSMIQCT